MPAVPPPLVAVSVETLVSAAAGVQAAASSAVALADASSVPLDGTLLVPSALSASVPVAGVEPVASTPGQWTAALLGLPRSMFAVSEAGGGVTPPSPAPQGAGTAPESPGTPLALSPLTSPAEPIVLDPASNPYAARGPPNAGRKATTATATAQPVQWIGTAGGNWNTPSNWSTGALPQAADDVSITLPAGQTVTITTAITVNSLTCDCDLAINSGGTLTLAATSQFRKLTLAGGTLNAAGAVTIIGAFDATGSGGSLTGSGTFTTQGTSTIDMPGFGHLGITKTWVNEGTLTIGSDDRLLFGWPTAGVGRFVNAVGATVILASTYLNPFDINSGGAHTFVNNGTLRQTAAGAHAVQAGIAFTNTGTVSVENGTLTLGSSGTDTGIYTIAGGAALNFSGGTRTLADGAAINGVGTLQVSGGTVNADALIGVLVPVLLSGGSRTSTRRRA